MANKKRDFFVGLALGILSLGGCAYHTQIQPQPPPPTVEQIAGTWMAVSSFSAYRLELSSDGTGALVSGFGPRKQLRQYVTDHWDLQDYDLRATFHPIRADTDPLYLRARAERLYDSEVQLRDVSISRSADGWNPTDDFIREPILREWLERLAEPGATASERSESAVRTCSGHEVSSRRGLASRTADSLRSLAVPPGFEVP